MSNSMNRNLSDPQIRIALERARVERAEALRALFGGLYRLPRLRLERKGFTGYRAAPCA